MKLLEDLGLSQYTTVFEDEELTEPLLRSMSAEVLAASLAELGLEQAHEKLLCDALNGFMGAASGMPRDVDADTPGSPSPIEASGNIASASSAASTHTERSQRLRAAAESGRRLAQEALERDQRAAIAKAAADKEAAAQSSAAQLDQRRQQAEQMALRMEAKVRAAPLVPAKPTPSPTTRSIAPRQSPGSRISVSSPIQPSPSAEEARAQRIGEFKARRRAEKMERENLLAEMRADRAYRQARSGKVVANDVTAAPEAEVPLEDHATVVPASMTAEASETAEDILRARVARIHASLVAQGIPPNEAAPMALRQAIDNAVTDEPDAPPSSAPASMPFVLLPRSTGPRERASRLLVRMPDGDTLELPFCPQNTVEALVDFIAAHPSLMSSAEAVVERYALLNGAAFPPVELDELGNITLQDAGLQAGATLVLRRRGATVQKGSARPKASNTRAGKTAAGRGAVGKKPRTEMSSADGRIRGTLMGTYTFADEAFRRSGMVLLVVEATPAGEAVLEALQGELRFLTFGFRLPPRVARYGTNSSAGPTGMTAQDEVDFVLRWLLVQSPQLMIRAIVGHGLAADACYAYASRVGAAASSHGRCLVQICGDSSSTNASYPESWRVLSISGSNDETSPIGAETFHQRHALKGHKLRYVEGLRRTLDGHVNVVASSINDWLEGARRLTHDDSAMWSGPSGPESSAPKSTAQGSLSNRTGDGSQAIGSMARAIEIQEECLADDISVDERMLTWSEVKLRHYFENGGKL